MTHRRPLEAPAPAIWALLISVFAMVAAFTSAPPTVNGHGRRRTQSTAAVARAELDAATAPVPASAAARARAARSPAVDRPVLAVPDASLPLAERVAQFVDARQSLLEAMDLVRGAAPAQDRPEVLQPLWSLCRQALRGHVADSFAGEIGDVAAVDAALRDALEAAASWESWDHLRSDVGRSPQRVLRAMELLVRTTLVAAGHGGRGTT